MSPVLETSRLRGPVAAVEGHGYAHEAALAARRCARDSLGWPEVFGVIASGNARSIRLAERLGASLDRTDTFPNGETALVFRHPAPEVLQ